MMDIFRTWSGHLLQGDQPWLGALLLLAALLILAGVYRRSLGYRYEGWQINRAARWLGARMLRDITLPDGTGANISIDILVLATDAILVIGVKRYDGMIFGGPRTDEWTQTINSRSYRFPNPDNLLLRQVGAVKNIAPKVPVRGMHLFTDNASFPWDKPANVRQVRELHRNGRRPALKDIPVQLQTAWTEIRQSLLD